MLVLSRRPGEEILIGDNVKLIVNRVSGGRVKIGITAPDNVRIVRGELGPLRAVRQKCSPASPRPD
jgi:carbon storage regulator